MRLRLLAVLASCLIILSVQAQITEKGPYTITVVASGVKHIEDANSSNPPGIHPEKDGKPAGLNNCSDMYLITGQEKVLLIDLSNFIRWDTSAISTLRTIVYSEKGSRDLIIAVTHNHGDHLGMLPAFKDDMDAHFWIPGEEFRGKNLFPADRTVYFPENASLDLGGGYIINSLEVPGHTPHSTIFSLNGRNLLFTGDALGSGNGVWLFSYDSFLLYKKSIDRLISYIDNPGNAIDTSALILYGGHFWQKGKTNALNYKYIADMQILIDKISKGEAIEEKVTYNKYLDTNFKYGLATITWNKADALKYSGL